MPYKDYDDFQISFQYLMKYFKERDKLKMPIQPGTTLRIKLECGCTLKHRFVYYKSDTKRSVKTLLSRVYCVSEVSEFKGSEADHKIYYELEANSACSEHGFNNSFGVNKDQTATKTTITQTPIQRLRSELYQIELKLWEAADLINIIMSRIR